MQCSVDILVKEDETWCATPSSALLEWIHERDQYDGKTARWIVTVGSVQIALGDPIRGTTPWLKELYLPSWIMSQATVEEGDRVAVTIGRSQSLPEAEHLNLKVLGTVPEGWDLRATLEEPLSQLGVLTEGQILPCPMLEGVSLLVQICQPAGPVFLHGNEVSLELEVEQETAPVAPFQPQVPSTPSTFVDDFASMLPPVMESSPEKKSFQAFQGAGNRLR